MHSLGRSVSGGLTERKLKMSSQKERKRGTSVVVQWLRLHLANLAMQGTQVLSLVRELRCHVLQSN